MITNVFFWKNYRIIFQKERHLQKKADKRKVLKKYFFQK